MVFLFINGFIGLIMAELSYIKKGKYFKDQYNYMLFQAGWVFFSFTIIYLFQWAFVTPDLTRSIIFLTRLLIFLALTISCFVIYYCITRNKTKPLELTADNFFLKSLSNQPLSMDRRSEFYTIKMGKQCINCSNDLHINDKYCEKCGSIQEKSKDITNFN